MADLERVGHLTFVQVSLRRVDGSVARSAARTDARHTSPVIRYVPNPRARMRAPVLSSAVLSELVLARSGEWLHARVPARLRRAARRATRRAWSVGAGHRPVAVLGLYARVSLIGSQKWKVSAPSMDTYIWL